MMKSKIPKYHLHENVQIEKNPVLEMKIITLRVTV